MIPEKKFYFYVNVDNNNSSSNNNNNKLFIRKIQDIKLPCLHSKFDASSKCTYTREIYKRFRDTNMYNSALLSAIL